MTPFEVFADFYGYQIIMAGVGLIFRYIFL